MAHKHDYQHDESYFLDQLCINAVCGTFSAIGIALYCWQRPMLKLMLAERFHGYVLWSGIALLALVAMRTVALWLSVRRAPHSALVPVRRHHEHGPNCNRVFEDTYAIQAAATALVGQAAPPPHAVQPELKGVRPPPGAVHADAPASDCDHGHKHDFAPWRYEVLLLPVVLFLLGLPNRLPTARGQDVDLSDVAIRHQVAPVGAVLSGGPKALDSFVLAAAVTQQRCLDKAKVVDYQTLAAAASTAEERHYWKGRAVSVRGQYAPVPRNDCVFTLVRFRINCCAADAIQLNVPIIGEEPLKDLERGQWLKVTGLIDFRAEPGTNRYTTVLCVPNQSYIVPVDPDPEPFIQ
jgi:hypothetical protein